MTIGAILGNKGSQVVSIAADLTVKEAVGLLAEKRIGAMPVLDGDTVAGIFSERDVIHSLHSHGPDVLDWPVAKVMNAPAITVSSEVAVLTALSQMTQRRIRHLPVVEEGQLVGIVSIGDLVKFRIDKIEQEAEAMRHYIASA